VFGGIGYSDVTCIDPTVVAGELRSSYGYPDLDDRGGFRPTFDAGLAGIIAKIRFPHNRSTRAWRFDT